MVKITQTTLTLLLKIHFEAAKLTFSFILHYTKRVSSIYAK